MRRKTQSWPCRQAGKFVMNGGVGEYSILDSYLRFTGERRVSRKVISHVERTLYESQQIQTMLNSTGRFLLHPWNSEPLTVSLYPERRHFRVQLNCGTFHLSVAARVEWHTCL